MWNKVPRLDTSLWRVSKKSLLAFEDMGNLQDPLDRRMEVYLKRAWYSTMLNLKPALATTCVARNLEFWLSQLQAHLESGSPREALVECLPIIFKAVAFIADASAESVQMSGSSSALVKCARRAFWLKSVMVRRYSV